MFDVLRGYKGYLVRRLATMVSLKVVESCRNCFPSVLNFTENAPHYLELDLGSGKVNRY